MTLQEFGNITCALDSLADRIEVTENLDKYDLVKELLLALANNLYLFERCVFKDSETQDIHYSDDSIIADCVSIETILRDDIEEEDDEDDFMMF